MSADRIEQIVRLAKRRGFGYPSAEIYHAGETSVGEVMLLGSSWDFGPLGVELKENIKRRWWRQCVQARDDVVGCDSSVILAPEVWQPTSRAPDRVAQLMQCQVCRQRVRIGHPAGGRSALAALRCPHCGSVGAFSEPQLFDGTVRASLGGQDGRQSLYYLRPDPIQGILINFANVMRSARRRPPFGIAQMGRSFRNGVAPGTPLFRTIEFEQMALAYFVPPGTDAYWHRHWVEERRSWYLDLGLPEQELRLVERPADPRGGMARVIDIQFKFGLPGEPWGRLEALANRNDRDLLAHSRASGVELNCYDQQTGIRWVPYVISPTAGLGRCVLAFLLAAMSEDFAADANGTARPRTVLRLDRRLAPVKVAVLPLSRNPELSPQARRIADELRQHWNVEFDDAGAIGRRYRRQDEIGTPFCVTLDFIGAADQTATVRERDTMKQERVSLDRLKWYLTDHLAGC